jgi:c-di-GMP-binding flagellar brake protein YcgR
MGTEILGIGDKIDICEVSKIDTHIFAHRKTPVMESRLDEVADKGRLVIQMPMHGGALVLLHKDAAYEMVFYTRTGLYRGFGRVVERFKEDGRYMARITLISRLTKFQRRKFYRMPCFLVAQSWEITEDEAMQLDEQAMIRRVAEPEVSATASDGVIVDISGGGIRIVSSKYHEPGDFLAVCTGLHNENVNREMMVPIRVITCQRASEHMDKYETRAEYMQMSLRLRETIIKYIFYEERKLHKIRHRR